MSDTFKTPQEQFWRGEFGNEYIERNRSAELLAANLAYFTKALNVTHGVTSCIEFGANIGMNMRALRSLFPSIEQSAIEINPTAAAALREILPAENVYEASIIDFVPPRKYDLAFIKGVLIHINPEYLPNVYDAMYAATGRYMLVGEYYNPSPVTISYRGHDDRLFKRDFAGEILDRFSDLSLIDYGFAYHRDPKFPQDDISWFLMEKRA
jgi:pseudaminic acid biosynthesis-associated methylase